MGRFASTVPFYERTRQPYGPAFFATVAERLAFERTDTLLDLGTGPGLLALGFAPYVGAVCGVDPERAMLDRARANAARTGRMLRLIEGTAESLPEDVGRFDIVTIGRALHWMEPESTRRALDRVVAPDGLILICAASSAADACNPWLTSYNDVRARWSAEIGQSRHKDHAAFFAGTRFRPDGTIMVEAQQTVTIDDLADRVLSMSSSSPERLSGDIDAMQADVRRALAPFAEGGGVREVVQARASVFRSVSGAAA